MEANGEYDIKKVRAYLKQLNKLVNSLGPNVEWSGVDAHLIIKNLVASLEYSVNTIEFLQKQIEMDRLMSASGGGSEHLN